MIDTFINARRLKNTYTKNSFIYWLKTIPLIGKLLPNALYSNVITDIVATIFFWVTTIIGFCLSHFLYAAAVFGISVGIKFGMEIDFFNNLWILLAIIGIFINSGLFEPSEDKYYGIMLMRMNAREYIITDLLYNSIRQFCGYFIVLLVSVFVFHMPFLCGLSLMLFSVAGKYVGCFLKLVSINKGEITTKIYNALGVIMTVGMLLMLPVTLNFEIFFTPAIVYIATGVMVILGVLSFLYLYNFKEYKKICKIFLSEKSMIKFRQAKSGKTEKKETSEKYVKNLIKVDDSDLEAIPVDPSLTSRARGFKYFNQIFEKRHASILAKRTKIVCIVIGIAELFAIGTVLFLKFRGEDLFDSYSGVILAMPFLMYFINTGEVLASAMFYNCDAAMLTYNFYRKPETILGVFKERLKTVIKNNLYPALMLAVGFTTLVLLSPAEDKVTECLTFLLLFPALSVFFSVHRLVIYYIFQPFTVGQEKKSSGYSLINSATYIVCYFMMQGSGTLLALGVPTIVFSGVMLVFSIVYVLVALLVVNKFAPKTFKLRN